MTEPNTLDEQIDDPTQPTNSIDDISLCDSCMCMTHTVEGRCGKCSSLKSDSIDSELENKNIKVNEDGTISPIDPTQPSRYSTLKFEPTDLSEDGIIRAILLDMDWCHAVKTESLDKTIQAIKSKYISRKELEEAIVDWPQHCTRGGMNCTQCRNREQRNYQNYDIRAKLLPPTKGEKE